MTRSIITALATVVILGVLVVDGASMFMAYQGARDTARTAAYQASIEYVSTGGNAAAAKQRAAGFVRSKGGEILEIELKGPASEKFFSIRVEMRAETYVLKFVPVINRYLTQEATAISSI